jgi:hypothetical protein
MSKSNKTKTTAAVKPVADVSTSPKEVVKASFDAAAFVKDAAIPKGTEYVFVTSDGQVFMPVNEGLAQKHATKKKLTIVKHTI